MTTTTDEKYARYVVVIDRQIGVAEDDECGDKGCFVDGDGRSAAAELKSDLADALDASHIGVVHRLIVTEGEHEAFRDTTNPVRISNYNQAGGNWLKQQFEDDPKPPAPEKSFGEYVAAIVDALREHPEWREGQAASNVLAAFNKRLYDDAVRANLDPFYVEAGRLSAFFEFVSDRWND